MESKWVKRYTDLREKLNMTEAIDKLVEEVITPCVELEKEVERLKGCLEILYKSAVDRRYYDQYSESLKQAKHLLNL